MEEQLFKIKYKLSSSHLEQSIVLSKDVPWKRHCPSSVSLFLHNLSSSTIEGSWCVNSSLSKEYILASKPMPLFYYKNWITNYFIYMICKQLTTTGHNPAKFVCYYIVLCLVFVYSSRSTALPSRDGCTFKRFKNKQKKNIYTVIYCSIFVHIYTVLFFAIVLLPSTS